MKSQRKRIILGILVAIGLTLFTVVYLVVAYFDFKYRALAAVPKYDMLNTSVLGDILPPPNTEVLSSGSSGVYNAEYGRVLTTRYYTLLSQAEVQEYYATFLQEDGWQPFGEDRYFLDYFRHDGCISISHPSASGNYIVMIWHNFEGQEFTPQRFVPVWFMKIPEFGYTRFMTCP